MIDLRGEGDVFGGNDKRRLDGLERGGWLRRSAPGCGTGIRKCPAIRKYRPGRRRLRAPPSRQACGPRPRRRSTKARTIRPRARRREGGREKQSARGGAEPRAAGAPSHALAVRLHHAERGFTCHLRLFACRVRRFQDLGRRAAIVPRLAGLLGEPSRRRVNTARWLQSTSTKPATCGCSATAR